MAKKQKQQQQSKISQPRQPRRSACEVKKEQINKKKINWNINNVKGLSIANKDRIESLYKSLNTCYPDRVTNLNLMSKDIKPYTNKAKIIQFGNKDKNPEGFKNKCKIKIGNKIDKIESEIDKKTDNLLKKYNKEDKDFKSIAESYIKNKCSDDSKGDMAKLLLDLKRYNVKNFEKQMEATENLLEIDGMNLIHKHNLKKNWKNFFDEMRNEKFAEINERDKLRKITNPRIKTDEKGNITGYYNPIYKYNKGKIKQINEKRRSKLEPKGLFVPIILQRNKRKKKMFKK